MYEVEVKVRAELGDVRDRLAALGAAEVGAETQRDTYYDHPNRSFADTDEALRIRRTAAEAVLTYKGPRVEDASKTREEVETTVDDGDVMAAMLEHLDFEESATVEKERECYEHDDYTVTLDRVVGAGEFVEVETEGGEDEIDVLREGAYDVLEELGLDPSTQIRTSYLELVQDGG